MYGYCSQINEEAPMLRRCPSCNAPLAPKTLPYEVSPTPEETLVCTGTCRVAYALYTKPGGRELLASFAEATAEPWNDFVERKWKEQLM